VNSHDIDTLRWFAGDDFAEVYAVAGNYRCPEARASHPDFYDNVAMTIRFARGAQGMIDGAQGVGYAYDARLEVLGTKGVLLVGALAESSLVVCGASSQLVTPAVRSWRDLFTEAYQQEDRAFVRSILEDLDPSPSGRDGLEAVKAVNAGNRSIRTGLPVKLAKGVAR
jgi:myo-inositol 2-dehydrogenase/D-chiro-inositol 1-dehydrogenase/scyllo-inositol 2-dehydrogenase (NAD+)